MALQKSGVVLVAEDYADFVKKLDQAERALQDFEQQTEKTAKTAKSTSGDFRDLGLAMGAVAAIGTGLGLKMAQTASRAEELGVITQVTAQNAAYLAEEEAKAAEALGQQEKAAQAAARATALTSEAVDAQVQAVKELGITTGVASQTVAQLIRYNLDWQKSTDLARLAQDAATFAAQDSSEAVAGLIHGITTLNVRVLRTYGIMISLEQEYAKFADANNRLVNDLTAAEKQQIAFQAVLEQAPAIAGAYEAAMGTASKQIRSLSRDTTELAEEFGEFLLPAFSSAVSGLRDFLGWLKDLPDPLQQTIVQIGGVVTGVAALGSAVLTVVPKITKLIGTLRNLSIVQGLVSAGLAGPVGIIGLLGTAGAAALLYADNQRKAHEEEARAIFEASESYDAYIKQLDAAGLGSYVLSEALYEVAKAGGEAADAIDAIDLKKAQKDNEVLLEQLQQLVEAYEREAAIRFEVGDANEYLSETFARMLDDMTDLQLLALEDTVALQGFLISLGLSAQEAARLAEQLEKLRFEELKDRLYDLDQEGERFNRIQQQAVEVTEAAEKAVGDYGEGMSDAALRSQQMTDRLIEQRLATQELALVQRKYEDLAGAAVGKAAKAMVEAEEDAAKARLDARKDLIDSLNDLEDSHAKTVAGILQQIEDADAEVKENLLQAERDYLKERQDAIEEGQQDLADLERDLGQDREDAQRDLNRDLVELERDLAREQEDIRREHLQEMADLEQEYADKREAILADFAESAAEIEAKYILEPEPPDFDDLRTGLQQQLTELQRIAEERGVTAALYDPKEYERILAELEGVKGEELQALEEGRDEQLSLLEQQLAEEQAVREAALEEEIASAQEAYEQQKADRIREYEERLEDLRIQHERERAEVVRANEQRLADLQERLAEEQQRIRTAGDETKVRLQEQLEAEQQNYADRQQEMRDHYVEQVATIDDGFADQQESIRTGLAEELREIGLGLGEHSQAFRDAYAVELQDLDDYLAERLRKEEAYQNALNQLWGNRSPSKWMRDFGKDLIAGLDLELGPGLATSLDQALREFEGFQQGLGGMAFETGAQVSTDTTATGSAGAGATVTSIAELGALEGPMGSLSADLVGLTDKMGDLTLFEDPRAWMRQFGSSLGEYLNVSASITQAPSVIQAPMMQQVNQPAQTTNQFNVQLDAHYARSQSEASLRDDVSLLQQQLMGLI